MTVAQSIIVASNVIKMMTEWIDHEIRQGAYSTSGGMGETYLALAESILRELSDEIAERRKALLANAPGPFEFETRHDH